jgi:hypothetical protein
MVGDKGVVCYLDWRDGKRSYKQEDLEDLKVEKGKWMGWEKGKEEEEAASGRVGRAAGHLRFIGGWC